MDKHITSVDVINCHA